MKPTDKDQEAAKSLMDEYYEGIRNGGEPAFPYAAARILTIQRGENEEANIIAASVRE